MSSNQLLTTYSTIACCLLLIDDTILWRMSQKFDICCVMANEGISLRKYSTLHELEEHHGVDLGFAYKIDVSAQTFNHYSPENQHQIFLEISFLLQISAIS